MNGLSRFWAVALLGSLVLNFFVAGLIISMFAFDGRPGSLRQFGGRGDASPDRIVRQITQRFGGDIRPHIQNVNEASSAVREALTADPFDEATLVGPLAELRAKTSESQDAMHDAMVQSVLAMSQDQRNELVREGWRGPGRVRVGR